MTPTIALLIPYVIFFTLSLYSPEAEVKLRKGTTYNQSDTNIITIYQEQETCSEWNILEVRDVSNYLQEIIDQRESAVFYHIDEENQVVMIEKKISSEVIFIRKVFAFKNKYFDICLHSCKKDLPQNKMKLERFCLKIMNGNKLK